MAQYAVAALVSPYLLVFIIAILVSFLLYQYSCNQEQKRGSNMKENAAFASNLSMNMASSAAASLLVLP